MSAPASDDVSDEVAPDDLEEAGVLEADVGARLLVNLCLAHLSFTKI